MICGSKHQNTLACPIVLLFSCVLTWGTFFTCHCAAKLSKCEPPPDRQRMQPSGKKGVSVTQARGQLNSICFNSRLLAGMLVWCIYKGFQPCQKISSVVKIRGWIVNSFRLYSHSHYSLHSTDWGWISHCWDLRVALKVSRPFGQCTTFCLWSI